MLFAVYLLRGNATGRWVTREEAFSKAQASSNPKSRYPSLKKPFPTSGVWPVADSKSAAKSQNEAAPGLLFQLL